MARVIVTGANGFVGRSLALRLRELDHRVDVIIRRGGEDLSNHGCVLHSLDLSHPFDDRFALFQGVDTLFHVAAKVDTWGNYDDFYHSNVLATRQLLNLCRNANIPHFIFTSSPSVVADGGHLRNVTEDHPYATKHLSFYSQTKALAEAEVLAATNHRLKTIALRPHLVFGPTDRQFIPKIISRAQSGKLLRIGKGTNLTDVTFIDDCVNSHLLAWKALQEGRGEGKSYFISQGYPISFWSFIDEVLTRHGLPSISRSLPSWIARMALPALTAISRWREEEEPPLSPLLLWAMTRDHYFDISRARHDLGFTPSCSPWEALVKTYPSVA